LWPKEILIILPSLLGAGCGSLEGKRFCSWSGYPGPERILVAFNAVGIKRALHDVHNGAARGGDWLLAFHVEMYLACNDHENRWRVRMHALPELAARRGGIVCGVALGSRMICSCQLFWPACMVFRSASFHNGRIGACKHRPVSC